jgi:protein-disulfide isomerase
LIRLSSRFACAPLASVALLACLSLPAMKAAAQDHQEQLPSGPTPATTTATAPAATAQNFPAIDPANFTATSPSKETVVAFLNTTWGYDDTRVWQVQAIQKTAVEGISKVVVLVGDKSGKQKYSAVQFFALPDGKHIIAGDEIIAFGEHPYAETRAVLQQRADGPYRGTASKELELVEFADFQCPHCKDAQANLEKLLVDFPKARIVFQSFPLERIHPAAANAAAYGVCVNKEGGSSAFFQFASAVFEGQDGLATTDGATLTLNSAVSKVGLEPAKIAACAAKPESKADVAASEKLAKDLDISQVPTLMINGRGIGIGGLNYDTLKQIIAFQAKLDGVAQ